MRYATLGLFLALAASACGTPDAGDGAPVDGARPSAEATARPDTPAEQPHATAPADGGVLQSRANGTPPSGAEATAPSRGEDRAAAPEGEASGSGSSAAQEILRRAERTYEGIRSLEADFVQRVTIPLLDRTRDSRGKIYHRRPDRFLMRFSDPDGDVVVADGRHLWMYYPSVDAKQVMRSPLGAGGQSVDLQQEFLSDANARFAAVHLGTEEVAGRPADVLVLTPREPSQYRRVKIWVDRQDSMVRRFEIEEQNESVRRLELRNLRPNVRLSDDLFEFTPPPGAQVFEP